MKKLYTIMLAVLLGGIAAQAQDTGYQPLVREGVRWVNQFHHENLENGFEDDILYYLEFKGDTLIGGKNYTKCYMTTDAGEEVKSDGMVNYFTSSSNTPCAYVREQDSKVWSIPYVLFEVYGDRATELESLIYDFHELGTECAVSFVNVNGVQCRQFQRDGCLYVESIGYVPDKNHWGDLLNPDSGVSTGMIYSSTWMLYAIGTNGMILYRNPFYDWHPYDVNSDGNVNIVDVNLLINMMLGKRRYNVATDMNLNGEIDIADINAVIDRMLGKQ